MNTSTKLHPALWVAAVSVTVLSLTGVASMLGWLPQSSKVEPVAAVSTAPAPEKAPEPPPSAAPVAPVAASAPAAPAPAPEPSKAPAAASEHKPAPKAVPKVPKAAPVPVAKQDDSASKPVIQPPGNDVAIPPPNTPFPPLVQDSKPVAPVCLECGRIDTIRAVTVKGQGSGLGAVAGGVLGGVLGRQVGSGNGRDLATIAGAVLGGYAANEMEKNQKASTRYEVVVHMEDGSSRIITEQSSPPWMVGQQVKVINGQIQAR